MTAYCRATLLCKGKDDQKQGLRNDVSQQATFRVVVFRPWVGEVIVGRLMDSDSYGPCPPGRL